MNASFWHSLTAKQKQVLLSMYQEAYPLHPGSIERRLTVPGTEQEPDTLGDLQTLSRMGLTYHTGPFWNLTKEGRQLIEESRIRTHDSE